MSRSSPLVHACNHALPVQSSSSSTFASSSASILADGPDGSPSEASFAGEIVLAAFSSSGIREAEPPPASSYAALPAIVASRSAPLGEPFIDLLRKARMPFTFQYPKRMDGSD